MNLGEVSPSISEEELHIQAPLGYVSSVCTMVAARVCSQAPFHNYVEEPRALGDGNHCCGQGGPSRNFLSEMCCDLCIKHIIWTAVWMGSKEGTRVSLRGVNESSRPDPVSMVETCPVLKRVPIAAGEPSSPSRSQGRCRFLPGQVLALPPCAAAGHSPVIPSA